MKKRDFFDSASEWKQKHMSIDYLQAEDLKELLHKNVEALSDKDARSLLEHIMYQLITGTHNVMTLEETMKGLDLNELKI